MKRNNENFVFTITNELEELIYENAISLLPEIQKQIYLKNNSKLNTNKNTYRAITKLGEEILNKTEADNDYHLYSAINYSDITCEYKSEFYIFNATLNVFEKYCNFRCNKMFFGGEINNNNYNSIIVKFEYDYHPMMPIDHEKTYLWLKKYNLNGVTLTTVEQCKKIFN